MGCIFSAVPPCASSRIALMASSVWGPKRARYVVPPRAGLRGPVQRLRVSGLDGLVAHQHVIEGAVDDGVEAALEAVQLGCVGHLEVDLHPGPLALRFARAIAVGEPSTPVAENPCEAK
jgi:hypothetical protein